MSPFTIRDDRGEPRQLIHDSGTNGAPFSLLDGHHHVFVNFIEASNHEIFLRELGGIHTLLGKAESFLFTATRGSEGGPPKLALDTLDVSSLDLGSSFAMYTGSAVH